MGNGVYYGVDGPELYMGDGTILTDSNGLSGKVVTANDDLDYHSSLPSWCKTSKVYFKRDDEGKHEIEQMRVFGKDRRASVDFDWNHTHDSFAKGVVHVHEWHRNADGNWFRSDTPRYMKPGEVKKYGELIKMAYPNVKFRP